MFVFFCCYFYVIHGENQHETDGRFRIIANLDASVISGNILITPVNNLQQKNLRQLFTKFSVSELQAVYRNRYDREGHLLSGIISSSIGTWQQIILNNNDKARELVALLKKEKGVLSAYIEWPIPIKPCIAPDDPSYLSQWHLRSISYPAADINAEQAWDINKGRSDVIIAVCDGGVDYTHPDLDTGDRSRVIAGYDSGSDDNDPMDDLPTDNNLSFGGHGTHVAGIIGAIANNRTLVTGVMWNCKIMPVKMVGSGGIIFTYPFGSTNWDFSTTAFPSDVADAIDYAVNNGAHVINLSYGFNSMGVFLNDVIARVPLLYNAILNAYNHNVVVVAAMGNEFNNGNPTEYPAAFPEVIAVGNTTNSNPPIRYSDSSTGSHICVSAPGDEIWSTIKGGGIGKKSGTSMSAPVVSGVAGLIISQGMDRNFNLTNDDVRHILERTAVDIGTVGFDNETGHGIVNAQAALQLLDNPNILYHYNSTGGTTVRTQNITQWILQSNRWGLAAGIYNVDQYKITKHVTFDVAFCSIPQVWMRERESKCLSIANPNSGRPFSLISNVTSSGFDLEYYSYYVRSNILGQAINKWVPAGPSFTNVAYSAVGQPNLAATTGPISGPSTICSSGNSFTINNPAVQSIVWTCGPGLTISSGQNTPTCIFSATGSANSWVKAILVPFCGANITLQKDVWVGKPTISSVNPLAYYINDTYNNVCNLENQMTQMVINGATDVIWERIAASPEVTTWYQSGNNISFYYFYPNQSSVFRITASNGCGSTSYDFGFKSIQCGPDPCDPDYIISPNPASGNITIVPNIPAPCDTYLGVDPQISEVMIVDNKGNIKKKIKYGKNTNKVDMDTSDLTSGTYYVIINDGVQSVSKTLIIKK